MSRVFTSRRLWTFVIAQVVSLATLIVGHFVADPFYNQVAVLFISTVEGVGLFVIGALTVDDIKANGYDKDIQLRAIDAGVHPDYPGKPQ